MMDGVFFIFNFEVFYIDRVNKVIVFMFGVVYVINGYIVEINEIIYLFGNKDLYDD